MTDEAAEEITPIDEETDFEAAFDEMANEKEVIPEVEPDIEDLGDEITEPGEKEVDIYAGMDEATKERFRLLEEQNKDLNHRLHSDAGRVSAFQRKINGLEKELGAVKANSTEDQPSAKQISEAMKGTDSEWAHFKEEYPEVANVIDNRFDKISQATQESIDNTLAPFKEIQAKVAKTEYETATEQAKAPVNELFPAWGEEVVKPEFNLWMDNQPRGIQALAESDDPQDAIFLIGAYDTYLVANGGSSIKAVTDPGPGVEKTKANNIAAKREQQLESGTTIKSKPSGIDPGSQSESEFESAFNVMAKKREAQRA